MFAWVSGPEAGVTPVNGEGVPMRAVPLRRISTSLQSSKGIAYQLFVFETFYRIGLDRKYLL